MPRILQENKEKEFVIYSINNLITGKRYIGRTGLYRYKTRQIEHKSKLKNNKHGNKNLQNSYNKYGKDFFEFEIIKKCRGIEESYIDEANIISKYGIENLYNISLGGDEVSTWSDVVKESSKVCSKPILQIEKGTLNILNEFDNAESAAREIGVTSAAIKSVTRGITTSCHGFYWIKKEDYNKDDYFRHDTLCNKVIKPICSTDVDGNIVNYYKTLKDASEDTNRAISSINGCLKGRQKTSCGLHWRYLTNKEIIKYF